jgi:outer membrane receptor for ferrienterochelin and colicins
MKNILYCFLLISPFILMAQAPEEGRILIQENNETYPLVGVNIFWLNTTIGTVSDQEGKFVIPSAASTDQLIVKYLGFKTDTLTVTPGKKIFYFMKENAVESLEEVELTQRRKAAQKSYIAAQNVMQVNSAELLKAACCNLSESFETNPSIDVNFSDALTGTKQIRMLGLSSPYLLITEENIPSVRGASQIYGLTYTPGTWIESIQITKGAGSVTNGFESIAGQINTELQKPFLDAPLFVNLFSSINGRQEANVHWNNKLSDKWSTGLYIHGNQRSLATDRNKDDFLDLPLTKQVNLLNRWQYTDVEKGWVSFLSLRYLDDQKQTGAENFNPDTDRGLTNRWGSEIDTQRFDASLKLGYVFPLLTYQSFGFQAAYNSHDQTAYYGLRQYDINHKSFFSNLLFNSILGNTKNKFKTGLNLAWDRYDEWVDGTNYQRTDQVLGAFFEYTYDSLDRWNIVAGLRVDSHNNLGTFITPRLHARYTPWERAALRFSMGQGRKVANVFAENQTLFATNRAINLRQNGGNIYGLRPEKAWNYGGSIQQGITLFGQQAELNIDYYVTTFQDQVVVDWETARYIRFYNLEGESYAKSFQLGMDYAPIKNVSMRFAYKNYQVKTTYLDGLKQKPLQPEHRFFANVDYNNVDETGKGWRADLTYHFVGEQRLAANPRDGQGFSAPAYGLWNAQLTRVFSPQFEIYLGGENLSNQRQANPVIGIDQPFGRNFDASFVYAPVFGRMIYAGLRFNLKNL